MASGSPAAWATTQCRRLRSHRATQSVVQVQDLAAQGTACLVRGKATEGCRPKTWEAGPPPKPGSSSWDLVKLEGDAVSLSCLGHQGGQGGRAGWKSCVAVNRGLNVPAKPSSRSGVALNEAQRLFQGVSQLEAKKAVGVDDGVSDTPTTFLDRNLGVEPVVIRDGDAEDAAVPAHLS